MKVSNKTQSQYHHSITNNTKIDNKNVTPMFWISKHAQLEQPYVITEKQKRLRERITNLVEVKNQIEFADIAEEVIQDFNKQMDAL